MQTRSKDVLIDAPNNTSINQKVGFPKSGLYFEDKMHFNLCIFLNDFYSRWVSVVEFHDGALGIGKVFGQESTVVKWNYKNFGSPSSDGSSKIGCHFSNTEV